MIEKDKAMDLNAPLKKLIKAADNHGEDDEPGHTVGDLQDMLRAAWALMSVNQKRTLLESDEVANVVMCGARGEFDEDDLLDNLNLKVSTMLAEIRSADYFIVKNVNSLYYWVNGSESGAACEHDDAVVDAYEHLNKIGNHAPV